MDPDVERARVPADDGSPHPTLFPLSDYSPPPRSARAVCKEVGLNWLAAVQLHEAGWLSFNPKEVTELNAAQEAELAFLGTLVAGGCDEILLPEVLSTLRKPYAYRMDSLYYDWQAQCWHRLPQTEERRAAFEGWLDQLVDDGNIEMLERLQHSIEHALRELRRCMPW
jgi:hypothetical protein